LYNIASYKLYLAKSNLSFSLLKVDTHVNALIIAVTSDYFKIMPVAILIILTQLLTYYSQNYAGIIVTFLIITYCAEYNFKMIYNKLIVPISCILSSKEAYTCTLKKN